jgi:plastocyanin
MPAHMNRCHRRAIFSLGSLLSLAACDTDEQQTVTTTTAPLISGAVGKATDEAPKKEAAYTELDVVPGAGAIQGTVTYTGNQQPATLSVTKDTRVCTHGGEPDGSLRVTNGKLENAVVAITDDIARGKRWQSTPAVVDNRECRFDPRVQIGRYGGQVEMKNSDPVFHNTNLAPVENGNSTTLINVPLPLQGQSQTKSLEKTGIVAVQCNVHEWMKAWIYVSKHPYAALTHADGTYEITGVPPGEYNAMVWHEALGQISAKVKVEPGGTATLDPVYE